MTARGRRDSTATLLPNPLYPLSLSHSSLVGTGSRRRRGMKRQVWFGEEDSGMIDRGERESRCHPHSFNHPQIVSNPLHTNRATPEGRGWKEDGK